MYMLHRSECDRSVSRKMSIILLFQKKLTVVVVFELLASRYLDFSGFWNSGIPTQAGSIDYLAFIYSKLGFYTTYFIHLNTIICKTLTSSWKLVKDSPNYMTENMIG